MTRARQWKAFFRDALIIAVIGVGVSLLPGKYDLGPWAGATAWTVRYVEWAVTLCIAILVGSRHLRRRSRQPGRRMR